MSANPFDEFRRAQPAANPFDEFQPLGPTARQTLTTAVTMKPDSVAEAERLAKRYPAPPEVIMQDLEAYRLQEVLDLADTDLQKAPMLREIMRRDVKVAAMGQDDIQRLADLERRVQVFGELKPWKGPEPTTLSVVTGLAKSIPQAAGAIKAGLQMQIGDALEAMGLVKRDPVYLANQQRKLAQAVGASDFTRPDFESSTAAGIYGGAESFLRAIPGVAASVAMRSPTPAMIAIGGQTQAEAYGKYRARGGTPGEAFAGATGEALVEIATEYLPGKYLAESLGKTGAKEFILNFIKKDALGEQAATILQDAIDTAIANPDKTWEQYLAERPDAAYQTLVATLTQAGLMSGVNTALRRVAEMGDKSAEAQATADALRQAMKGAEASLLRERSPEQFRAVMSEMSQDGTLYVDAGVLNQMPPEVLAQLPGVVEALQSATADTPVEVKLADALTVLPGTPQAEVFMQNARTSPDAPSLVEAETAGQKAQEFLQQEAQRVIEQAADQEALRQSQELVKTNIKEQLAATGRFRDAVNEGYATWAAAFYTAYGSRLGMTPEQFYQRYPLRVLGAPVGQQTGVLNAGERSVVNNMTAAQIQAEITDLMPRVQQAYEAGNAPLAERLDARLETLMDALDANLAELEEDTLTPADLLNPVLAAKIQEGEQGDAEADVVRDLANRWRDMQARQGDSQAEQAAEIKAVLDDYAFRHGGLREGLSDTEVLDAARDAYDAVYGRLERQRERMRAQAGGVFNQAAVATETEQDRTNSLGAARISPRLPTAKKATENALGDTRLQPDLETAKRDSAIFAHNIGLMVQYPNFQGLQGTTDEQAEAIIKSSVDNLLWLHDHWKPEYRERSKLWYVGGNRIAHRWAERFGVTPEQVAAVIAATSPQKDWFQNVSLAERILEAVINNSDAPWDAKMSELVRTRDWGPKAVPDPAVYEGKTLRDLYQDGSPESLLDMAIWIRAWDEANNPMKARVITPEGGFTDKFDAGKSGKEIGLRWQSFPTIVKTLQVLMNNDRVALSEIIGANHKVRSFYNNIIAPYAGDDVTIDTHAVAAALLRPLGSSSTEVFHNFGSGEPGSPGPKNSAITGLYGTYAIYAEAYRRAAKERGILPREMQSITWEAVRGLFRPEQKNERIRTESDRIWSAVAAGELDANDARKQIEKLVGGIQDPAWVRSPAGTNEARADSSYAGELPRASGSQGTADGRGGMDAAGGIEPSGETLQQAVLEQGPRGTFNPQTLELVLNPNADLSTWFHETGHFFLEVLADVASQPDAPAQIVEDYNKVLAWFGVTPEQWAGFSLDEKRPYHERWAESIEQYVMEGKAPSVELQGVMRRFRAWLTSVYGSIKQFLAQRGVAQPGGETLGQAPAGFKTKAVGVDGAPLVLFHGTRTEVRRFDPSAVGSASGNKGFFGDGFYFTNSQNIGSWYAGNGAGANVMPVYLQVNKPLVLSENENAFKRALNTSRKKLLALEGWTSQEREILSDADIVVISEATTRIGGRRFREVIQANGYDAVHVKNSMGSMNADEWVVFDPKQIVSAISGEVLAGGETLGQETPRRSTQEVARIFSRMVKEAEQDLTSALFNWNDSRLNEDKDKIVLYPGRDARFVRGKEGGKSSVSKAEFLNWLMSDAPFDPAVYGESIKDDAEWRGQIEKLRGIVSPQSLAQGDQPAGSNIQLNDDIRRVMDRMLATDEQIAQANEVAGFMPDEQADGEAAERLQKRSMADLKWAVRARDKVIAKLKRQAREVEKAIREQVTVEVDQMPEMRAKAALDALAVTPEYAGILAEHKAQRQAAETQVRQEITAAAVAAEEAKGGELKGLKKGQFLAKMKREIGNQVEARMIEWDRANPRPARPVNATDQDVATIADSFGFESVDAMLQAIDAFGKRADAIDGLTEQRMLEENGDLIDERAIQEAANEAVHNEARARSLATELRTQREMLGQRTDTGEVNAKGARITVNTLVEAAKQFGARVVARTPLKDLKATAWKHTAAERRAGKRWAEATAKGETQDAVQAKQDQVLNNAAAKAAIDAATEAKKILEFFRRVTKGNDEKTVEKGRDPDIVNAARAVLAAYGVETPTTKAAAAYLEVLQRNDPETYAALEPMVAAATANAQPLQALTFEELQGLAESIQAMWHLAKRSRQMEVNGDLLDIDDVAQDLYTRLEEIGIPDRVAGEGMAVTQGEERTLFLQQGIAFLRRVEQWAEGMDGKYGGPFLRFIFQPIKDAADRYRAERITYRKKFQGLVDNLAPIVGDSVIQAPELGYTFGTPGSTAGTAMNEILHAIAHTGNDSNKRKLLLGRGWATENPDGTLDTSRWDAFIRRLVNEGKLERAHFDFVQGVWDLLEQTKPLAQKAHRDAFGRYFSEVTANAFVDPFGVTRRGGYVPAQVDSRQVKDNALRKLAEEENNSMAYAFPQPAMGFTKGRTEYNRPLMLDLRTLSQHLDKVLLFSHMTNPARDVRKLLMRPKVNQPLNRVQPAAIESMLQPWLQRSAQQIVEDPIVGSGKWARIPGIVRSRAGMALMFANVSNAIQQITGLAGAAVRVKPSYLMRSLAQYVASPVKFSRTVWDASPYMDDRAKNEVAVMNEQMQAILIKPSTFQKAQDFSMRHAYFLQTALDNVLSPIVWTGALNQALADGMSEQDAIRFADSTVRQTQGSTLPEDVSRFETGPAYARAFTQFVSYFNMMANTNGTALKQIAGEVGLKKGAGKALYVVMMGLMAPIWVAEAIALAFKGGPEDEDDDGYLDDWLAAVFGMGTTKGLLAQIPILGQFGVAAANRFNDNPLDDRVSLSPAISLLESSVSAPESVYKAIVEDGSAQKAIRDVATLVSVATGVPVYGLARPIGYAAGVAQGKIEPTGPVDVARGLVTGTASPESKVR